MLKNRIQLKAVGNIRMLCKSKIAGALKQIPGELLHLHLSWI